MGLWPTAQDGLASAGPSFVDMRTGRCATMLSMSTQNTEQLIRRFRSLIQIRRGQMGQRAAATQRKIETLRDQLRAAGITDAEMSK